MLEIDVGREEFQSEGDDGCVMFVVFVLGLFRVLDQVLARRRLERQRLRISRSFRQSEAVEDQ